MPHFAELIEYADGFDPSFSASLVPATTAQIEQVEQLAGRNAPDSYREFLETMGQSTGWVKAPPFDLRVDTVIEFYREGRWLSETAYFRIGEGTVFPIDHPHLEDLAFRDRLPEVIAIPDYAESSFRFELRGRRPICGSLLELIGCPIFERFELKGKSRRPERLGSAAHASSALDSMQEYLLETGFELVFFSTINGRYFTKKGAAIRAWQDYLHPLQAEVSADAPVEQQHLVTALRQWIS